MLVKQPGKDHRICVTMQENHRLSAATHLCSIIYFHFRFYSPLAPLCFTAFDDLSSAALRLVGSQQDVIRSLSFLRMWQKAFSAVTCHSSHFTCHSCKKKSQWNAVQHLEVRLSRSLFLSCTMFSGACYILRIINDDHLGRIPEKLWLENGGLTSHCEW